MNKPCSDSTDTVGALVKEIDLALDADRVQNSATTSFDTSRKSSKDKKQTNTKGSTREPTLSKNVNNLKSFAMSIASLASPKSRPTTVKNSTSECSISSATSASSTSTVEETAKDTKDNLELLSARATASVKTEISNVPAVDYWSTPQYEMVEDEEMVVFSWNVAAPPEPEPEEPETKRHVVIKDEHKPAGPSLETQLKVRDKRKIEVTHSDRNAKSGRHVGGGPARRLTGQTNRSFADRNKHVTSTKHKSPRSSTASTASSYGNKNKKVVPKRHICHYVIKLIVYDRHIYGTFPVLLCMA